MIEMILEKFTDITKKCLEREAIKEEANREDMALVFKLGEEEEVIYMLLKNYHPIRSLSFLEVLNVRIDFKGYSLFVPKFIRGALNRFCVEEKIKASNVSVIITFNLDNEMKMWLYDKGNAIKEVELESLFDTQDILK